MRNLTKRRKLVVVLLAAVVAIMILGSVRRSGSPVEQAVSITLVGKTNLPSGDREFVLFAVTNKSEYDVRWHGDVVEIEGNEMRYGRISNPSLPGQSYLPVLKSGESLQLWMGEPFYGHETGRWRFTMSLTRYGLQERWFDEANKGKVPMRVGPVVLVDSQKLMNPTNYTRVSSEWVTKTSLK